MADTKISALAAAQSPLDVAQLFVLTQDSTPDVNLTFSQLVTEIFGAVNDAAVTSSIFYCAQFSSDGGGVATDGFGNLHASQINNGSSVVQIGGDRINFYASSSGVELYVDEYGEGLFDRLTDRTGVELNASGLKLKDATGAVLYLTNTGLCGIKNATPLWTLDVSGDINFSSTLVYSGTQIYLQDNFGNGGTTLCLLASDNATPMYLHVTSGGVITATTTP